MMNGTDRQRAAKLLLDDESLINKLNDAEAKALIDWALTELDTTDGTLDAHIKRLRDAMTEINTLVGDRQNLVADDLEERLTALLVGDLDPKSHVRLEREREIAQVTAEKDHLEGVQLVHGFTEIASKTWRARDQVTTTDTAEQVSADTPSNGSQADTRPASTPTRARPIPRPAKIEPQKLGLLQRLLGRK